MTTTVSGSQITFNDNTTQNTSAYGGGFAFRNRIINGDMRIDQRNAGASVSYAFTTAYSLDRWRVRTDSDGVVSVQQVSDAPTGFVNSLKTTVTTIDSSLGASQSYFLSQLIEGNNIADLDWGLSTAKTVTLSFWVKSSVTGTFGGSLENSAENRAYPFTYAISSANTWEQKSVTITGDTTGTWLTTNGVGIRLNFGWGVGSTLSGTANVWAAADYRSVTSATNLMATNGATWQITGVQLEKGSTATSFDYRPYGTELALCQRYAYQITQNAVARLPGSGIATSTTQGRCNIINPVTMRSAPSLTVTNVGNYRVYDGTVQNAPTASSIEAASVGNTLVNFSGTSGLTVGRCVEIYSNDATSLLLSAEL